MIDESGQLASFDYDLHEADDFDAITNKWIHFVYNVSPDRGVELYIDGSRPESKAFSFLDGNNNLLTNVDSMSRLNLGVFDLKTNIMVGGRVDLNEDRHLKGNFALLNVFHEPVTADEIACLFEKGENALTAGSVYSCPKGTYIDADECTPCEAETYQDEDGHREKECKPQPYCGQGERMKQAEMDVYQSVMCEDCPVFYCPALRNQVYPSAGICDTTFQSKRQHQLPECSTPTDIKCSVDQFMKNRGSQTAMQRCVDCKEGTYMDIADHSYDECIEITSPTTTATSTPTSTAPSTPTTTIPSTATTTPNTTPTVTQSATASTTETTTADTTQTSTRDTTPTTTPFTSASTTPTTTQTTVAVAILEVLFAKNDLYNQRLYKQVFAKPEYVSTFVSAIEEKYGDCVLTATNIGGGIMKTQLMPSGNCVAGKYDCFQCEGLFCVRCMNGKYNYFGECVEDCSEKDINFENVGLGEYDRRCTDNKLGERDFSNAVYARKGISATIKFKTRECADSFSLKANACQESECVMFTPYKDATFAHKLCPHTMMQEEHCAHSAAASSSFLSSGTGIGAIAGILVAILVAVLFIVKAKSGGKGSNGIDHVVSFDNPMYDSATAIPSSAHSHTGGGGDVDGLYADIDFAEGDTGGLYDEPAHFDGDGGGDGDGSNGEVSISSENESGYMDIPAAESGSGNSEDESDDNAEAFSDTNEEEEDPNGGYLAVVGDNNDDEEDSE
jgi:hypothetical protein